ncbi:hypothetical protein CPPEL_01665 [Corynebacterium pseudopelargi]|uniref:Lipoprotein LpqE n=2 Tax=Corynebacterium pseudopelargi TaxID=2080757 RepID=A0A3G6IWK8_9CORY|nr:hypothetical protein CPPEL_01665 [Corynebacterium pseudopelargi]
MLATASDELFDASATVLSVFTMEDVHVKSLKSAALAPGLACCALVLASCGAGQITQTDTQVAAVDGASANTADNLVSLRDVTVQVKNNGKAGLKFTASNLDKGDREHTLKSVSVEGKDVSLDGDLSMGPGCSLVADLEGELKNIPSTNKACLNKVATSVDNPGFPVGGNTDVKFVFDDGQEVNVVATISEPLPEAGSLERQAPEKKH